MPTSAERAEDMYLRALRSADNALDGAASLASNRGDYALANRIWFIGADVRRLRTEAREQGMRYLGSLPPEKTQ